jgi:chromosome segregation ATPase
MTRRAVGMVAGVMCAGWLIAAQAQAPGAGSQDILPALLAEVRGLRVAMEQMTSAGSRVQLALGRLQLQEQRLAVANARLAGLRDQLAGSQRRYTELQEQIGNVEATLSGQRESELPKGVPPEQARQLLTMQLRESQREFASTTADIQRLTAEEAAIANEVSGEQARSADLNQRLDELERALQRPVK